jgi:hypothetical protein
MQHGLYMFSPWHTGQSYHLSILYDRTAYGHLGYVAINSKHIKRLKSWNVNQKACVSGWGAVIIEGITLWESRWVASYRSAANNSPQNLGITKSGTESAVKDDTSPIRSPRKVTSAHLPNSNTFSPRVPLIWHYGDRRSGGVYFSSQYSDIRLMTGRRIKLGVALTACRLSP